MLGAPFGQVVNILLLKAKNQGFIELSDSTAASRMVNYYSNMPATIRLEYAKSQSHYAMQRHLSYIHVFRSRNVYIQYSKHQELKIQQVRYNIIMNSAVSYLLMLTLMLVSRCYSHWGYVTSSTCPNWWGLTIRDCNFRLISSRTSISSWSSGLSQFCPTHHY